MLETKHTQLKNSGIAWIGSIPNDWMLKKIDYMSTSYSGGTPDRDNYSYWENGTVNWMSSGEVNKRLVYDTYEKISLKGLRNSSAKLYPENTVVFALNGQGKTKGMTAILKTISSGNQSLVGFICDEKELHYRFLDYCFQAAYKFNRSYYGGGDNRDGIAASNIKKMKIPTPSYNEQICLCDFLDFEIKKLDNIIASAKKSLELLQETRKSIIFEAVTKGMDSNVEMKDSGVEWIGEIPSNWKYSKIRYTARLNGRIGWQGLTSDEYIDEGPFLVTGTDFIDGTVDFETAVHIPYKRWKEAKEIQVENGDLLITKDGTVGKVAMIDGLYTEASLNSGVLRIRPNMEVETRYLYWILNSEVFWKWFNFTNSGNSTILHLYQNVFEKFSFPLPDVEKQRKISKFLDYKISKIDNGILKVKEIISLTEKTKQSLIYEYVTGKKRVQI